MKTDNVLYRLNNEEWNELNHLYKHFKHRIPMVMEMCVDVIIKKKETVIETENELIVVIQFLQYVIDNLKDDKNVHKKLLHENNEEEKNVINRVNLLLDTLININIERIRDQEEELTHGYD